ncbi:MAG: GNAT family N-acetyltransferase [Elusimicrobia bacterium]|nr:GNAT family N-acetyltransferase [Elusimicrobiota bacterium]
MTRAGPLRRRTRRLEVRPLAPRDYARWRDAYAGALPKRNAWDGGPRGAAALTRARFRALLAERARRRAADGFYDLAVFRRDTGELVGTVSAMDVLRGLAQSAYLGYSILNRHWRRGYGKEAVRAMLDVAFRDLRLHRVEAGVEPGNRRSIALARSLGLRREGLKRRAVFLRGRWVDLLMYSATCEEFGIRWTGRVRPRRA